MSINCVPLKQTAAIVAKLDNFIKKICLFGVLIVAGSSVVIESGLLKS